MFYNEVLFFNNSTIHIRFVSNFALQKVSDLLQAKGMNPEVAVVRAKRVFGGESEKASLYLQNLQHYFGTEVMLKIYDFIMQKALFQESIKFTSYDHMLRMIQEVYRSALDEKELKQIKQIAQANHYAISLVR